ncbi:MAG: hypothetical protein AUJ72_06150 [Candidatus Omnitrophica bacterium CG1_02_46_14]|nr:MAG: hypothetical protein AUJ72_06150 [Candidatus Omnitrophica bacterium CG1_02_46_14]
MKKAFALLSSLVLISSLVFAAPKESVYQGSGEVTSVDPLYSRITIKHGAIKNFVGDSENEFFVQSSDLLKNIAKRDFINFTLEDQKGDVRITKIEKTGVAAVKDETLPIGRAVQDVLTMTGEAVKTISSPIAPAHEVVSETVGATTGATDSVLHDANPEVKKNF